MYELEICNFMKIKYKKLEIPENGFILLEGKSGQGKTTIFTILQFLFHDTITQGCYPWFAKTTEKTYIRGKFNDCIIYRQRRPNLLHINVNGKEYIDDIAQTWINKKYGSSDLFSISTYIKQNNIWSFFSLTGNEKLSVMQELIGNNNEKYEKYLTKLNKKIDFYEKESQKLNIDIKVHEKSYYEIGKEFTSEELELFNNGGYIKWNENELKKIKEDHNCEHNDFENLHKYVLYKYYPETINKYQNKIKKYNECKTNKEIFKEKINLIEKEIEANTKLLTENHDELLSQVQEEYNKYLNMEKKFECKEKMEKYSNIKSLYTNQDLYNMKMLVNNQMNENTLLYYKSIKDYLIIDNIIKDNEGKKINISKKITDIDKQILILNESLNNIEKCIENEKINILDINTYLLNLDTENFEFLKEEHKKNKELLHKMQNKHTCPNCNYDFYFDGKNIQGISNTCEINELKNLIEKNENLLKIKNQNIIMSNEKKKTLLVLEKNINKYENEILIINDKILDYMSKKNEYVKELKEYIFLVLCYNYLVIFYNVQYFL